ncbi:MAG: rnfG [Herbinix sp.]|jgi:electron transport complex protein RnfG|nr:rnfG [Herbinix sp.]
MENSKMKEKSTLLHDAIALFLITLISGLALSYVFEITKAPIEKQQADKQLEAYQSVFAQVDTYELDETLNLDAKDADLGSLNADFQSVVVDEVNKAFDSNGTLIGYILKVTTSDSYKDHITIAIGYSLDGTVKGIEFLAINETAGLGMNAVKPEFKGQFSDKNVEQFEVTKTGATTDNQIDALSSATITSRAVVNAVNAGIGFIKEYSTELGGGANE